MLARAGLVATLGACAFNPVPASIDARDAPDDISMEISEGLSTRVKPGLIGFWTFDIAPGATVVEDTSGSGTPVPLDVDTASHAPPVFASGNATATTPARVISAPNNHLPMDCKNTNAVTLEAWVSPNALAQGRLAEPAFIVGLAQSVTLRDIVLLQADTQWLGRVRTSTALDGKPDLVSVSIAAAEMTHLVLVADNDERRLYVNNQLERSSPAGNLNAWDATYRLVMFEEPQQTRAWVGTIALVAMYNRALSEDDVEQNFNAGPDAPP